MIGVGAGLQRDETEIDLAKRALWKDPDEIEVAGCYHAEADEPGAQTVGPRDLNLAVANFDVAARDDRPEHRAGWLVHKHGIGPLQHVDPAVDISVVEHAVTEVEADHEDVAAKGGGLAEPRCAALIKRHRCGDL